MTKAISKFLIISLIALSSFAVTEIKVITYYNYSPWLELNTTFTELLNSLAPSHLKFVASYLPRKRLDQVFDSDAKVIVPFTNPKFFNDTEMTKYTWSSVIFQDHSFYISRLSRPFSYKDQSSYTGKKFSGILGHKYADLENAIKEKKIEIEYAPSTVSAVLKVFNNKRNLDFSVIDTSTLKGMERLGTIIKGQYFLSKRPVFTKLERMVLVNKVASSKHRNELLVLIDNVARSDRWIKIINNYQYIAPSK